MRTNRTRRDALDAALDQTAEQFATVPADVAHLARVAFRIRRSTAVLEVPEALAERHLAAAVASHPTGTPVVPVGRKRARAWTISIAVAALLGLSATSAVAASASALPGDALYGLKRAVERARLAVPGSDALKAQLHLTFADERLAELQELLARRQAGEDVDVGAAMAAYEAQLAAAEADVESELALGRSDEDFLDHVLARIDKHVQRLEFIRDGKVPEQAKDAIQRAIDNAEKAKGKVGHGRLKDQDSGKPDNIPGRGRDDAPGQQKQAGALNASA